MSRMLWFVQAYLPVEDGWDPLGEPSEHATEEQAVQQAEEYAQLNRGVGYEVRDEQGNVRGFWLEGGATGRSSFDDRQVKIKGRREAARFINDTGEEPPEYRTVVVERVTYRAGSSIAFGYGYDEDTLDRVSFAGDAKPMALVAEALVRDPESLVLAEVYPWQITQIQEPQEPQEP